MIDNVRPQRLSLLLGDMRRRGRRRKARKGRQPDAHLRRIVVDNVVDAAVAFECSHSCCRGILYADERIHAGARADDRVLLLPYTSWTEGRFGWLRGDRNRSRR